MTENDLEYMNTARSKTLYIIKLLVHIHWAHGVQSVSLYYCPFPRQVQKFQLFALFSKFQDNSKKLFARIVTGNI